MLVREVDASPIYSATGEVTERLSAARLVSDLAEQGIEARAFASVEAIVAALAAEAGEGDALLIMSNGGFDGIFDKLFDALGGPDDDAHRRFREAERQAREHAAARAG